MIRLHTICFSLWVFCCPLSLAQATEVKEVVSAKGIKAWLVEEHALPLVAVKIAFRDSGFAYDPSGQEGRANMAAALFMEGAGEMDSRAFNEALETHAVRLNFGVEEDMLKASLETLSEHREKAFSYLSMALTQPRFDATAIERVRSQTLSLLMQQEQLPHYMLQRGWQHMAFADHPYANPVLGTKETVAKFSKSDLQNYTHRYLSKDNLVIGVVGDITPEELSRLLDTYLATLPSHYDPDMTLTEKPLPSQAQQQVIDYDIPQTVLVFGTQGLKRSDPHYFDAYVMNHILGGGGGLSAKLGQEIRQKRGLAYTVYSQLDPMMHAASWRGGFSTRNEEVGQALDVLRTTLKEFAANGPSDKELSDAKQYLTGSFVLGLDSNSDIANYLISMQLHHLGLDYLDKRNQKITAVRKEDVKTMAKQLVDPDHLLVVMVGKPKLAAAQ